MRIWLKADTVTATDLDVLASWNDSGPLTRNLAERASGKGGVYRTNQQNGLPGVTFNGTDQGMGTASLDWDGAASPDYTIYVVMKVSGTQGSYPNLWAFDYAAGSHPAWPTYESSVDNANGPYWSAYDTIDNSYGGSINCLSTPTSNTTVLLTCKRSAVTQSHEINGTQVDSEPCTSTMGTANTTFSIGYRTSIGRYAALTMFEFIAFNTALSAGDDRGIKSYLAAKYGLSIA